MEVSVAKEQRAKETDNEALLATLTLARSYLLSLLHFEQVPAAHCVRKAPGGKIFICYTGEWIWTMVGGTYSNRTKYKSWAAGSC